ncbi:MAG: hypothetical protein N2246_03545 [Candidatus Sumerlaeia bacterium]|nr:hypothetical protein [Candidatus Sumerlaeia bacterium]
MSLRIKADSPLWHSWKFRLIAGIVCIGGIVISATYLIKTDKEIIIDTIKYCAHAVEEKNVDLIAPFVSEAYSGDYGESRETALSRARADLKLVESITIKLERIDVRFITSAEAEVLCYFFVQGYYTGSDIYNRLYFRGITSQNPREPDTARFVFCKETDGIWRVVKAELKY